jgi:hypothetical protein
MVPGDKILKKFAKQLGKGKELGGGGERNLGGDGIGNDTVHADRARNSREG